MKRKIGLSVTIISIPFLCFFLLRNSNILDETNVEKISSSKNIKTARSIASISSPKNSAGSLEQKTLPVQKTVNPNQVLEKNISTLLNYMKYGPSKITKEEFEYSSKEIGKFPLESLGYIKNLIEATKPHESELRSNLYGAIAQIVTEARLQKYEEMPRFVESYKELVRNELKKDTLIINNEFDDRSLEWRKELTHLQPYKMIQGQLYSINLPAQLAAMYALGLCNDSLASEELKQISQSSEYENNIRKHAALLAESKLMSL